MTMPGDGMSGALVVVIPAYNEARAIGDVLARAAALGHRLIVVDDGSTDQTPAVAAQHPVRVLRHTTNCGKGAALLTGIRQALDHGAARIVTLDADGQHRP